MRLAALLFASALAASPLRAAMEPLRNNGAVFTRAEIALPLRCLESRGLLSMAPPLQDALLDKAASAGFNSVSFAAPLFGPDGFCQKLGGLDQAKVASFMELLAKLESRELYAFPVLWDQPSVAAFSRAAGGAGPFFTGKIQNQWQAWLLKEFFRAAAPQGLSGSAAIGGWIVYRGPWPGPKSRGSEASDPAGSQAFTAPLRNWLLWQLRALRQSGSKQMAGADFILKNELGEKNSAPDAVTAAAELSLPLAPALEKETALPDPAAMDRLPPLPGIAPGAPKEAQEEALTPWDLEGVDWDSVGRALREVPAATGLDFVQVSLDTEDWFRVGEAMGAVGQRELQTPLVWRQDWRAASRYERQKRLEAPEGVAGLMGPWPDDDWPEAGESVWPPPAQGLPKPKAVAFKYLELISVKGAPVVKLHLNRKGTVELLWDKKWPPSKRAASLDPALLHELPLKGAKFGDTVLFYARAKSPGAGRAVLRSRWMLLKAPQK
jgi:hypothetical protein